MRNKGEGDVAEKKFVKRDQFDAFSPAQKGPTFWDEEKAQESSAQKGPFKTIARAIEPKDQKGQTKVQRTKQGTKGQATKSTSRKPHDQATRLED
jgi:hypothetical protein